jgi:dihydroorotate dehydrogenase (fumarate)
MINLSTTYLGLKLRTPMMSSASPLAQDVPGIRCLEDAGASAVVLPSLFEEQLRLETLELDHRLSAGTESFPEALSFFPQPSEFHLGPEEYLGLIRKAKQIEQAGADALECNIYFIPTEMDLSGATVEQTYLEILNVVKSAVVIPVAVKLSPFFSNLANMAKRLDAERADGLVLFNRFYQPDIDLEELEVKPNVLLSTPQALRLPLTWIGILYGRVRASLAATSGIHTAEDVLKMLMVGADVTMFCSALFRKGPFYLREVEKELLTWMEEHEYESVKQMRGSMSQLRCADPSAFERAQYMRAIKSYQPA